MPDISRRSVLAAAAALPLAGLAPGVTTAGGALRVTTSVDLSTTLASSPLPSFGPVTAGSSDVVVNPPKIRPFLGTGAALTDSAAYVLTNYLTATQRSALLTELFAPGGKCNWRMLRICIGSPDFRAMPVGYTYDDMPTGQTDPGLAHFSISKDEAYILPVISEIVAIRPDVKILATPWTPPAWMLASGTFETGGCTFNDKWMSAYAQYFVKFLQAYQAAGIPIWAVTCQNEPVSGFFMKLSTSEESSFIGLHLGPALAAAGFGGVQILALEDSWRSYTYGEAILGSSTSAPYTAGVAYHGYAGSPSVMSAVHHAYPFAGQHLTEFRSLASQTLAYQMATMAGGYTAQGMAEFAQSVILWNLALDQNGQPNQNKPGRLGVVTVDSTSGNITRRTGYYALTHLSMFAQPGALRCVSTGFGQAYNAPNTLPNDVCTTALLNPDGSVVLYAYNGRTSSKTFHIIDARTSRGAPVTMQPGELSTFTWPSGY